MCVRYVNVNLNKVKRKHKKKNSVDPDQTAPLGAVWSGSALFAQAYLSENLGSLRYNNFTGAPNFLFLWSCTSAVGQMMYLQAAHGSLL